MVRVIESPLIHQPEGWLAPGYIEIDDAGTIVTVGGDPPEGSHASVERLSGALIPGMANVHSHAHQRGLVGLAERSTSRGPDTFWTWRDVMYRFANLLSPDDFEAIAAQAYLEMLQSGFTSVGEFHYLHNDPDGQPYDNLSEMSDRVISATRQAGIGLTLLPALYTRGGIERPPDDGQRRFILEAEEYAGLLDELLQQSRTHDFRLGIAPHSLRAVAVSELRSVVLPWSRQHPDLPVHMHVAEQPREVEECLDGLGAAPAQWLFDNAGASTGWTFIHSTHCSEDELRQMAERGVIAGLCPTTEASLADGLFPLTAFDDMGGHWGIGTDANNRLSVVEELRVLAYGQRLRDGRREVLSARDDTSRLGRLLYDAASTSGARSIGQPSGSLTPRLRADLIELDLDSPLLSGHSPETLLDAWVFGGSQREVRSVMVAGRWIIQDHVHPAADTIETNYRDTMRRILARL